MIPSTSPSRPLSVQVDTGAASALCRYGLEQLLRALGVRASSEDGRLPDVYCGADACLGQRVPVWIPQHDDEKSGDLQAGPPPALGDSEGVLALVSAGEPSRSLWVGNRLAFDVGWAAAYFLTLAGERHALCRDSHQRVPADASVLAAHGRLERPPFHAYADLLAARLQSCDLLSNAIPRWPGGKRYAAVLTHDVDAPEIPQRADALLRQMLLGGPQPRRHAYWALRAEIRARGLGEACLFPPTLRREWDFSEICDLEAGLGLRSAFYFAVVNRAAGHACDVSYDASRLRYRRLCRRLLSGGWEVGLHAAYATHENDPPSEQQARRFEQLFGERPAGVRHHYLRLDAEEPLRTLATNADAGFCYDTTVGFNDQPGFRMGVALPVEVFDPRRGGGGALLELPMTLADMHLPKHDIPAAVEAVTRHLQTVRSLGGLAVLNWHVGTWHSAPAWREGYAVACRILSEDSDIWVATPREVADWWRRRAAPSSRPAHCAFNVFR